MGRLSIVAFGGLAVVACLGASVDTAEAGRGSRHPGSGYGVASNPSDPYVLASVFSGIYGLRYSYDRAHYDFNGCRARDVPVDLIARPCR